MPLTFSLPPDLEARLAAEAERVGVNPTVLAVGVLDAHLPAGRRAAALVLLDFWHAGLDAEDQREAGEALVRGLDAAREEGDPMPYERTTQGVREALCAILSQIDAWFDRPEELRRFRPASGSWSVDQVLEHVTLTNRFLMLTLGKWAKIAEHRATRGDRPPEGESDLGRLDVIGERGSFGWVRPEHMEPTGAPSAEVRATLHQQLGECLIQLERIGGGVGALCRVTMTVNALGKIDLYQWLYFLAQHARRHLQQLAAIETEFAFGAANHAEIFAQAARGSR